MREGENIRSVTDERGNKYFVIYSANGAEHKISQHLDALTAIQTGVYFPVKPVVDKQIKKRK